ncbi:Asp-tRNA(Asn)/Glu-tRNA(Gln) amidotransferase GatCAB subunit C [Candidatus Bathyarchaeota archaeon ex4484_231]|nr:MAG: Asp-tRNA(Asn)/Glu-tRNA(Gln) amidotransferase GatCAB subunit C [Candidatus Bathyarchaeota archaeon ex4484_231]RJS75977.1 MAG: Asp-tRNA(Asn)/Glu-tRNA(Gln) amidotransferase subunit GatC [Candidatus Bathyarchaeota archaeon]
MKQNRKTHICREEVEHVAWLAHIKLTEEEKNLFTEQFSRILDYFKKIDEADTDGVPPTYHVLDLVNIFREDKSGKSLPKKEVLKNAPRQEDGFFKSPRIV